VVALGVTAAVRDGRRRRWRFAVAGLLAALTGLLTRVAPPDLEDFAAAGERLLGGRLDGIYESGWNQAGPLQLLISRVLLAGGSDGVPAVATVVLVNAALMAGALRLCRGDRRRELAAGLLTLLWLALPIPWDGHPAELAVPLAWAYAMDLIRSRRPVAAATILGSALAVAPWAVLGFPVLLAGVRGPDRGWGRVLGAAVGGGALGMAVYLPFVAAGRFGMFGHVWPVADGTIAGMLGLGHVTWPVRVAQAVVIAGGCGWVAWRWRGRPFVIAAAPATAALLRVATDPVDLRYYWGPVAVTTVLALARAPGRRWWTGAVLGYLALLAASLGQPLAGAVACLAVLLAMAAV
jgi:hypothetical protein